MKKRQNEKNPPLMKIYLQMYDKNDKFVEYPLINYR